MEDKTKQLMMSDPAEMKAARKQIDYLDESIVRLLAQRFQVAALIGQIKKQNQVTVLDQNREQTVLKRVRAVNSDDATADYIENIYHEILANSRAYQCELIKNSQQTKKGER
ncbi:hypothetical protein YK48G_16100 [Lentilactobacillus fungorum]|uniref:Chorismate mutase domain-containing protein n=1 Tax=Lentilactobacillus fungorum TaxID=2201250 RepID=A0ABQ3VZ47_9LACO|nr:chorismate mutase [Lentilactobacillus fungorum]GHP14185.1 hypothetical protein YK48G_16100 [Lentilactobacillus fungorum]